MSAESAYLFRHAMMRLAAYELQPPLERSQLHAHAYTIIESLPTDDPDLYAHELADHARDATLGNPDERRRHAMQEREAAWLKRAMMRARARSNFRPALECAERLLDSPAAAPDDRHAGGVMASEMAAVLGETDRVTGLLARSEALEPDCRPAARGQRLLVFVNSQLLPQRRTAEAETHLQEVRDIARECGDRLLEARAAGYLGNVFSIRGGHDECVRHYEDALAIFRDLDHKRGISTSIGNLGLIYRRLGEYEKAEAAYAEALAIDREIGNREGVPRHIGNLGVLYRDTGRLEQALELCDEAGDLFRDLGERLGMIRNAINQGDILSRMGQKQRAVQLFQKAERLAREAGIPHLVADSLYFSADVLLGQGDTVRGEPAMGEAALLYEQLGDLRSSVEAWHKLAVAAFGREDYDTALRCADSCLGNLDASGEDMKDSEYAASAILAESALAVELHSKAGSAAQRALQLAPEFEKDPIRVATLKAIAKKGRASSAT